MDGVLRFPIIAFYASLTRFFMFLFAILGAIVVLALVFTEGIFIPGIKVQSTNVSIALALWDFILFFSLGINAVDFLLNWRFYMGLTEKESKRAGAGVMS